MDGCMDYTRSPLSWRLRKAGRYVRVFGPSATVAKIRAQYHFRRSASDGFVRRGRMTNTRCLDPDDPSRQVAIVGCGKFAYSVVARHLAQFDRDYLRATFDIDARRALSLCRAYKGAYATDVFDTVLDDEAVTAVFIASNHASHAPYAIASIERGKGVHIEKPQAVTIDQLDRLVHAMVSNPAVPVVMGYNRPRSPHFHRVERALGAESGPTTLNWFIAGHAIDDSHWYFSPEEGGRVLGNMCHWLDASIALIGLDPFFPCKIRPASPPDGRNDFILGIECSDGSLVSIAFSAKGHTFEGVREVLNAQRGSTLAMMRDFEETRIEAGMSRSRLRTAFRSHGHSENVKNSYLALCGAEGEGQASTPRAVLASGLLTLAAREALESGRTVEVELPGSVSADMGTADLIQYA